MNKKNVDEAILRIKNAKKNKLRFLDLSGLHLTEIPIDISDMIYLFDLDLSYNRLTFFPEAISKLYNLQYLNLSNNSLFGLDFDFCRSYSIKELNISNNLFNFIPEVFDYFNEDLQIIFEGNPFLNGLPPEIYDQEDLAYIKFYIDSLQGEDQRERLFETKLLVVGKGDVGKTTLVKVLRDSNYKVKVGKESSTHGINIATFDERIVFPAEKPYYNKLKDFDDLIFLEDDVNIDGDLEDYNNNNIQNSDFLSIIEMFGGYMAYDDLRELRVISEPKRAYDNAHVLKSVKINAWDFGGQEILYSTHQFFLTQRSLYLFVWEPRSDTEEENFEYWLNIIRRKSKNSPVIVIMNKADIRIKGINEAEYQKEFQNIYTFLNVSCVTREGISKLKSKLKQCISELPHMGDVLPESWDIIRRKIKNKNENFITLQEFKRLCNFNDSKKENYLSEYLNDLGDIIYFNDDFRLRNLIILNPEWLTKAIYELIHSLSIQKNNGFFNANEMDKYFDRQKYPKDKDYEILSLMERFEICFKVTGSNNYYVIPALLKPSFEHSEIKASFIIPESLKFRISYNYLLSGLIERLICRLNNYLDKDYFWKYGAIFKTEESKALVVLNTLEKSIEVFIIGEVRGILYNVISHEISQINQDLKLLKDDFKEMIACNCNECVDRIKPFMFDKSVLKKFLSKDEDYIHCQISAEKVGIEKILLGYKHVKTKDSLIRIFIEAFSRLQGRAHIVETLNEDDRNTYLQDLLIPSLKRIGVFSNDQTKKGRSESKKNQGELDMSIETIEGRTITFFEGFNLRSLNQRTIRRHLNKTYLNYDFNGLREKFIGIYCEAVNFNQLSKKYIDFCNDFSLEGIEVIDNEDISDIYVNASEIKVIRTRYKRSGMDLKLYHILVNLRF